jgi:hypothetical protein
MFGRSRSRLRSRSVLMMLKDYWGLKLLKVWRLDEFVVYKEICSLALFMNEI